MQLAVGEDRIGINAKRSLAHVRARTHRHVERAVLGRRRNNAVGRNDRTLAHHDQIVRAEAVPQHARTNGIRIGDGRDGNTENGLKMTAQHDGLIEGFAGNAHMPLIGKRLLITLPGCQGHALADRQSRARVLKHNTHGARRLPGSGFTGTGGCNITVDVVRRLDEFERVHADSNHVTRGPADRLHQVGQLLPEQTHFVNEARAVLLFFSLIEGVFYFIPLLAEIAVLDEIALERFYLET